jgi:hypothetical protein
MSQKDRIRQALVEGHSLTPLAALARFGCFRLAARIKELRDQGMPIRTTLARTTDGKRVATYWLGHARRTS